MNRARADLAKFSCVYFVLAFINLRAKLLVTSVWFDGHLGSNHARLLAFDYVNHEQSRLLQYFLPELWRWLLGVSVPEAYMLQRWLFVFLAFVCFHLYLRKWFDEAKCFLAVVLLAALMPLTYFNHLQESSPLLTLTFVCVLWAIRERRNLLYAAALAVGAANNETVLMLPAVYFFYHFERFESRHLASLSASTVLTALPAYAVTFAIRYATRDRPYLGGGQLGNAFEHNLKGIAEGLTHSPLDYWQTPYLFIFLLYGALWIFAFMRFSEKPRFLRRASLVVPLFVAIHLAVAVLYEVRQMLPLAFIILPMALLTLFPEDRQRAV